MCEPRAANGSAAPPGGRPTPALPPTKGGKGLGARAYTPVKGGSPQTASRDCNITFKAGHSSFGMVQGTAPNTCPGPRSLRHPPDDPVPSKPVLRSAREEAAASTLPSPLPPSSSPPKKISAQAMPGQETWQWCKLPPSSSAANSQVAVGQQGPKGKWFCGRVS